MIKALRRIFALSFLLTATAVYAQVAPSVTGGESSLWAGGEFSSFQPDYGSAVLDGAGALVDLDLTPKIGAIGEARWLHWHNSNDGGETQSDYLAGAKYRFYKHGRFSFNAKLLVGGVWITYPANIGSGSYFAFAPGGFVDYRLSRRFLIRGDYEYQILPSAPDIPGFPSNGLEPHGFNIGVEYNILHPR